MIEANVNLGHFTGDLIWDLIPIMTYPPDLHSDLSLDLFLDKVIEVGFFVVALFTSVEKILQISLLILIYFHQALKSNSTLKKGIKLDFKRTDILEESLQILTAKLDLINFPLWINANIIDGHKWNMREYARKEFETDLNGLFEIVNADVFLSLANKYAPIATVSLGKYKILIILLKCYLFSTK